MKLWAFPKNGHDKCGVNTNTRVTGYSQSYKAEVSLSQGEVAQDEFFLFMRFGFRAPTYLYIILFASLLPMSVPYEERVNQKPYIEEQTAQ